MTAALTLVTILLLVLVSAEAVRVSSGTVRPGLHEFSQRRHAAGRRWLAARVIGTLLAIGAAAVVFPVLWALLT